MVKTKENQKQGKKYFPLISASLIITLFALLWNGFIHLIILKNENAILSSIHRPDMNEKMWISIFVTLAIATLFSYSYSKWRKTGSYKESMFHSLFFAVLMIVVVDINQYVQYAIPFTLVSKWDLFGLAEFLIYGLIITFIYRKHLS